MNFSFAVAFYGGLKVSDVNLLTQRSKVMALLVLNYAAGAAPKFMFQTDPEILLLCA